jgi:Rhs element Vgr protein
VPLSRTLPIADATRVSFAIKVNGSEISRTYVVTNISVYREANRIPRAVIQIMDGSAAASDFPVSNEEVFIPGNEIEIQAGYNAKNETIFSGLIVKHSLKIRGDRSPVLTIECMDKAAKLTLSRKNKYYAEVKDSEVIEELASAASLDPTIEATTVKHKELVQYYCTDWDFIVTRAESNGKLCFVEDGKLLVKKPDMSQPSAMDMVFGATILELDAEMDARHQVTGVETVGWDPAEQQLITTTGAEPGLTEQGNISSADLADVFKTDPYHLQHAGSMPEDELQAWADAQLLKNRLAKIRGRVRLVTGNALVKPGMVIQLGGIGERFSGKVYVTGVRHEFQDGTWSMDVQFGLAPQWFATQPDVTHASASAVIPGIKGLHTGIVTDLEDPDGGFRVKVKLPEISADEEGTWARMASFYAGNNRTAFFRPEIDDEVIVGFLHEDPNFPVILGSLHSAKNVSPEEHANDNFKKIIFTASELKMTFDDEKKSFTVETPGGKKISIDDDGKIIKVEDENGNKMTMESSAIKIESAGDLELKAAKEIKLTAPNVTIKADAALEVEGGASAKVGSSGTCTIKGSLVQIN